MTTDRHGFASVRREPPWRPMAAVRAGCILYPDGFPEDLRPVVRAFHLRPCHRTPSESRFDALIATAERPPPA